MGIDGAELYLLVGRATDLSFVLAATGGQVLPRQDFPVHEEIVVENAGRGGKQERVFFRFILRIGGGVLDQQVVTGLDNRLRFARAEFLPLVFFQVTGWSELQFRGLGSLVHAFLGLELGGGNAAAAVLQDGKLLGGNPPAVHGNAQRAGVNRLARRAFLFVIGRRGHGRGDQPKTRDCHQQTSHSHLSTSN